MFIINWLWYKKISLLTTCISCGVAIGVRQWWARRRWEYSLPSIHQKRQRLNRKSGGRILPFWGNRVHKHWHGHVSVLPHSKDQSSQGQWKSGEHRLVYVLEREQRLHRTRLFGNQQGQAWKNSILHIYHRLYDNVQIFLRRIHDEDVHEKTQRPRAGQRHILVQRLHNDVRNREDPLARMTPTWTAWKSQTGAAT